MKLILLLSALLSALIGAQGQARLTPVPMAASQATVQPAAWAVPSSTRPDHRIAIPSDATELSEALPTAWALAPTQPIYLSRRRE